MKRIVLSYGVIAGLVVILSMLLSLKYGQGQQWLGFLIMFIAFSSIYFAIRQYRDDTLGGVITFSKALLVGVSVSAVAGVIYVVVWEVYINATNFAWVDTYVNDLIETKKSSGVSDAEVLAYSAEMSEFSAQYRNPLFRVPMTFIEIFPVGLLVSLVSAGVLKNHKAA